MIRAPNKLLSSLPDSCISQEVLGSYIKVGFRINAVFPSQLVCHCREQLLRYRHSVTIIKCSHGLYPTMMMTEVEDCCGQNELPILDSQ